MKQKLTPGAELDLLTEAELRSALAELREVGPVTVRPEGESFKLDASGNIDKAVVYEVPLGMEFTLHRLRLDFDDGSTVAAPFTNANGFAEILRGDSPEDFMGFAAAAGGVPAVKTWSGAAGIVYRNGETVALKIVGGPASKGGRAKAQGTLAPVTSD